MKTEFFDFCSENTKLSAVLWLPECEPKAVLQITHGMTEHIGRYERFAERLTLNGIAVCGFDLRGHGKNGDDEEVASFGINGWQASLNDMRNFFDEMKKRIPETPYFMFGFSLGSFLLREYLSIYLDGADGAVIMGTGCQPGFVLSIMKAIVKKEWMASGFDNTTTLVKKLSFETYNQKFKPNETDSDWHGVRYLGGCARLYAYGRPGRSKGGRCYGCRARTRHLLFRPRGYLWRRSRRNGFR